ncbi:MAG: hypothetical protein Q9225_005107 [Loekoesia sp. 1 TL-2023]
MADPASIFSIIAGSAGLALQCGKVIRDLHNIAGRYKNADLSIISMTTGLETVDWAWRHIESILKTWTDDAQDRGHDADTDVLEQLGRSLKGGRLVITALEEDLRQFTTVLNRESGQATRNSFMKRLFIANGPGQVETRSVTESSFMKRSKIIWNEGLLQDHQERIRDQVNSMNLLINVLQMPDATVRRQKLGENQQILRKSDESANTIVPSGASMSTRESLLSLESEKSLTYRELDVDDDLFTARVYKRNYRNQKFQDLLRKTKMPRPHSQEMHKVFKPEIRVEVVTEQTVTNIPQNSDQDISDKGVGSRSSESLPDVAEIPSPEWVFTEWLVGDIIFSRIEGPRLSTAVSSHLTGVRKDGVCLYIHMLSAIFTWDLTAFECIFNDCVIPLPWLQHCLMTACGAGFTDLVKLVIKRDKDICWRPLPADFYDMYGYRHPYEYASSHNRESITELLIPASQGHLIKPAIDNNALSLLASVVVTDAGIVNHRFERGRYPIHLVCQRGHLECLGILIEAGADLDAVDSLDISAFRYLALRIPPEVAIIGWLPWTSSEREEILEAILRHTSKFTRPAQDPRWHWAYNRAITAVATHLYYRNGLRYIQDPGPGCCSSERVLQNLELHIPGTLRRPDVVASLENIRRRTRCWHEPIDQIRLGIATAL